MAESIYNRLFALQCAVHEALTGEFFFFIITETERKIALNFIPKSWPVRVVTQVELDALLKGSKGIYV